MLLLEISQWLLDAQAGARLQDGILLRSEMLRSESYQIPSQAANSQHFPANRCHSWLLTIARTATVLFLDFPANRCHQQ
jgi:hypothetical protein